MSGICISKDDRSMVLAVTRMSRDFHAEAGEKGPFDPARVSLFLSSVCGSEDAAMFVATREGGQPIGFLVCQFGQNYLTGEKMAEETAIYVSPAFRRTRAAATLLEKFESWGRSKGAARLRVTVQSSLDADKVSRWFGRNGYSEAERSLTKEVHN